MPVAPPPPSSPPLTGKQRDALLVAKSWWTEGDRSLDYLAEMARQENLLARLQQVIAAFKTVEHTTNQEIALLLKLARQVTGNRALNRTLVNEDFPDALRQLLFGEEPLPERLTTFLKRPLVGTSTLSHFLYVAHPDRFPLVSPQTRAIIHPAAQQIQQARTYVTDFYGLTESTPLRVRDLLADFVLYENVLTLLGLSNYTQLNAILWHATEMPESGSRHRRVRRVQEQETNYAVEQSVPPITPASFEESVLLENIENEIAAQGFTFSPLIIRDYYISLKAKPFVILTGLSGTGKTRLTRLLADTLSGSSSGQYLLVAVRPDWHDSTSLLGYHNLLTDRYISTPFLEILQQATRQENRGRAFFVCLDEMNLARVEHYFAEVLSAMETEESVIHLHEGRTIRLPSNVFLAGSVNMDEATHPFSRKVLDRANTIEFTQVNLLQRATVTPRVLPEISFPERQRLFLANCVTTVQTAHSRLAAIDPTFPQRIIDILIVLNDLLAPRSLHFGYRVRDEILRYAASAFSIEGKGLLFAEPNANLQTALDLQILQKVLPRLTGTTEALSRILHDVETWAVAEKLTRTAEKLARIRIRATEDGFVTFYEF